VHHLHKRTHLSKGDVAIVNCSHQCNVMLMTDLNYSSYQSGRRFEFYGGHYSRLPARIAAPSTGYWNVVLDLGGGSARITHSITFLKKP